MIDLIKVSTSIKDLWQAMYGARKYANDYELSLMQKNFNMQLEKLMSDGKVKKDGEEGVTLA